MKIHWHLYGGAEVLKRLQVKQDHGLSPSQVKSRQQQYGLNKLPEGKTRPLWLVFINQFKSPLIFVLLGTAALVYWLGDHSDSFIILFVLFFNATIGTIQEGRANQTLKVLRNLSQSKATVRRNSQVSIISDTELVPGDIVLLHTGEKIPADLRILEGHDLQINESALTGESIPVRKVVDLPHPKANLPVADQINMALKGTYVTAGAGIGVVVAIGLETHLGQLSQTLEQPETVMPLQQQINRLIRTILVFVSLVSIVLLFLGLLRGYPLHEMIATVASLGVSAIPEGLPIVLTITLATGLWRLSKQHALVKKLQAAEALGQTTLIAIDKTGTITKNELMVTKLYTANQIWEVTGSGYSVQGEVRRSGKAISQKDRQNLELAGIVASLTASAHIDHDKKTKLWHVTGDPTEAALTVLGQKLGYDKAKLLKEYKLIEEFPFSFEHKYHAALYQIHGQPTLLVTGAPEVLIHHSQLTKTEQKAIEQQIETLSKEGLRLVAFATKAKATKNDLQKIQGLTFGGLYGMEDTLQPGIQTVVKEIQQAGIRLVMITGDHAQTAQAIAAKAGIYRKGDSVLTGLDLEQLSAKELKAKLKVTTVFARVSPIQKEQLIELYRETGEIIAMTGDGVNDAPSLVAADIGIALGRNGTEVAKEAADLVLLDDNLKSLVTAIKTGRSVYKTLQTVILYLFSTSLGEILAIGGSLLIGLPLPVTAAQILWLNLVTDGFLDISLALSPQPTERLTKITGDQYKSLITGPMYGRLFFFSSIMMVGTLWYYLQHKGEVGIHLSSLLLTLLAAYQWFNAWNCRDSYRSVFQLKLADQRPLIAGTITVILLHAAAINWGPLQEVLHTTRLSLTEWLSLVTIASSILWLEELRKLIVRLIKPTRQSTSPSFVGEADSKTDMNPASMVP